MSRRSKADQRAVTDLEQCFIHLARASERMRYVDDYLEHRGGNGVSDAWQMIADAEVAVQEMLEDKTLEDAAKVKKRRRR